jgi:two-component system sensor histidine kinase BaeS
VAILWRLPCWLELIPKKTQAMNLILLELGYEKVKLKLLHKIFLANVSVILMLSLILLSFSYYGFKSMTLYIEDAKQEVQQLVLRDLASVLAQYYSTNKSWQQLKQDPIKWRQFLEKWHKNTGSPNQISRSMQGNQPPHSVFMPMEAMPPMAPRHAPEHMLDKLYVRASQHLLEQLDLLTTEKDISELSAISENKAENALLFPIKVDGITVGWLKFTQGDNREEPGLSVLKGQFSQIIILTLLGVLLSAAVSFYLARHFINPLRRLTQGAIELSERKFDTEIVLNSKDELAELAQYFNDIGRRLASYEQQQKQWLQDIAHELRTPLTLIRGEIEAMVDGVTEPNLANLKRLKSDVLQLNHLINDLNELSITDNLLLNGEGHTLDIAELCQQLSDRYRAKLANRNITLIESLTPSRVKGDDNRLYQVLINLMENELRYCQQGGSVWLSCWTENSSVVITIEDTGPGVKDEVMTKLFDRLFRADNHRNRDFGGAGLGLAICKNIVHAHGGRLAASRSEKGGLKITINLPLLGSEFV